MKYNFKHKTKEAALEDRLRNLESHVSQFPIELLNSIRNSNELYPTAKMAFVDSLAIKIQVPSINKLCYWNLSNFSSKEEELKLKIETISSYPSKCLVNIIKQWENSKQTLLINYEVERVLSIVLYNLIQKEKAILDVYRSGKCPNCGNSINHETLLNRGPLHDLECPTCR